MFLVGIPNPPYYMGSKGDNIKAAIMRTTKSHCGRFIISYQDVGTIISAKDPAVAAFLKRVNDNDKIIQNGRRYVTASAVLEKLMNDCTLGFDVMKTQQFEYSIRCLRALV
ncbi:hypothetical protein NB525_09865 [Vibrio alginolyticus]|uniref:hypothetical protein n=1 Tax=Vibrio alginolyticus TaxID=663 RepID=UPI00215CF666|nr:hypothetical protein [Vibrio alginolyticus]MCR9594302.1 hypothetical protein [Vibrio alginolyticus]HDY7421706.1 hypothetical protein [Vibrio vulnificus]HDY7495328.1 hypothetical protein [Vibrio vulnificus]